MGLAGLVLFSLICTLAGAVGLYRLGAQARPVQQVAIVQWPSDKLGVRLGNGSVLISQGRAHH